MKGYIYIEFFKLLDMKQEIFNGILGYKKVFLILLI